MTIQTSARGRRMPASPIRKLMPLAEQARRRGLRVFHLNIGQPDLETPPAMRARLAAAPAVLAYTPSAGTPECLSVLRQYYERQGIAIGEDEIIVTTGGSEAILFALMACADPGDEALLAEPFYTNYSSFAEMAGVRLVPLRAHGEDGFHLPPIEEWKRALTGRTRLVLLNNPNNPTGTVYRQDEVAAMLAFCREHGLFLVGDEVYREFVYDGRETVSVLNLPGGEPLTVLVDSLSKRYSACGIRLGCFATRNRELHDAVLRMAQGRLSPPGLAQLVALGASELGPEYAADVRSEYQGRRDLLYEGLSRIPGVFLRKPEGAFYVVARLPLDDAEDFARWLLSDFSFEGGTVMVAPAQGFYATPGLGRDEVRIAYVLNKTDLERAIRMLERAIPAYQEQHALRPAASAKRA
jgi:aspartate aminotransferase